MEKKRPASVAEKAVFLPARMRPRLLTEAAHCVAVACAPEPGSDCWMSTTIKDNPMKVPSSPSIISRLTT